MPNECRTAPHVLLTRHAMDMLAVQVADEHGLELQIGLPGASTGVAAQAQAAPEADLSNRLAELRGR